MPRNCIVKRDYICCQAGILCVKIKDSKILDKNTREEKTWLVKRSRNLYFSEIINIIQLLKYRKISEGYLFMKIRKLLNDNF